MLALLAVPAVPFQEGCDQSPRLLCKDGSGGTQVVTGVVDLSGATLTLPAGAGTSVLGLSPCTPVSGGAPVFMVPGGCGDPAEASATTRLDRAGTFANLNCVLSGTTGAQTVTVTARVGACGAIADSTLVCTVGAGGTSCDSGATFVAVGAGECLSFRFTSTAALPAARGVGCTVERLG